MIVALVPLILLALAVYIGVTNLRNDAVDQIEESRERLSEETILVTTQNQADVVAREINLVLLERLQDVLALSRSAEVVDGAVQSARQARELGIVNTPVATLEADFSAQRTIGCLLYTSPSPRDATLSRMPSSA